MINEFYAALLNERANNKELGHDYVPTGWSGRPLIREARNIRNSLLISENDTVSQNWRALELRELVESSDLMSLLTMLDKRTGYLRHDIRSSMVSYFTPRIIGTLPVRIKGVFRADAYRLQTWEIETSATHATVSVGGRQLSSTLLGPDATLKLSLPDTDAVATIETQQNQYAAVTWAAVPQLTLADTAEQLRGPLLPSVKKLHDSKSVFHIEDLDMLQNLIKQSETPITVAAATLLFVGHVLAR